MILVCLMTSPLVTSCSNGDSKDETTPESSAADPTGATETAEAEAEAETETTIYDDLPTGSYDGHCFNMLNVVSNYAYVLLTAEDITGEPINDAVYNRNVAVGDKLNVSFSENIVGWNDIGPAITNMVMSDEYTYDIVFDESQSCIKYPAKKQVLNLYDVPGLNFEKPWWDAGAIDTLSIGNSLYMANGDIHLMYGESAWVLFLNKNMLDKLKLESPYEIVKEGRWTYDKPLRNGVLGSLSISTATARWIPTTSTVLQLTPTSPSCFSPPPESSLSRRTRTTSPNSRSFPKRSMIYQKKFTTSSLT